MSRSHRIPAPLIAAGAMLWGMLLSAASGEEALSIRHQRTGALYTVGEPIVVSVSGPPRVSVEVTDSENRPVPSPSSAVSQASAGGSVTLEPGRLPLSWYTLTVTAGNKSARTAFGVVPPLNDRVAARQSRFGAIVSPRGELAAIPDIVHSLKLAGVRWLDIDIPMAQLNPGKGVYDWESVGRTGRAHFDAFARAAHKEGLCLMLKFLGQADWVSKRTGKDVHASWDPALNLSPPGDAAQWAEAVRAVVGRYRDVCDTWEIGNEPEGHGYFKGSDDEYMAYLETTARAIRAVQPKATIVAASMYNGGGVLPRLVKRPDLFDVMSVHYITGPHGDISPLSHYLTAMKEAGISKTVWNTESRGNGGASPPTPGESSHYSAEGAHNQSPTKAYVRNFALGVSRVFVFSWNLDEGRTIVDRDDTPRRSTVEFRTMADQLEGAEFVRKVELGKDFSGYHFRGGDDFLVAWSDVAGRAMRVRLTAKQNLTLTDTMGRTKTAPAENGVTTVEVAYEPVFVHGLAAGFEVR